VEVEAVETANAIVDVLGVTLGAIGALYAAPVLWKPSVRLTQGLLLGIVGALIGVRLQLCS
jgi:hypothetical protein